MDLLYSKYSEELSYKVLIGLCLLLVLICGFAFIVNYSRKGFTAFAIIDLCLVGMYIICLYFIRKHGVRPWSKALVTYSYIVVIILMTTIGKLNAGILNWVFTIPLMLHILYSKKHACITSLAVMLYEMGNIYQSDAYGQTDSFSGLPNFFLAYGLIWLLANIYVTQNNHVKQKIIVQATKDPLTGALNRLPLKQCIEANTDKSPLSLCLLDIDFFKLINDKYGHDIGDKVLIRLVDIIVQKTSSTQVYRLGGEEFVIVFNDELPVAVSEAEEILACVNSNDYQDIHHGIALSFSAGVTMLRNGDDLSAVLKRADDYLYKAKSTGRNKVMSELNCF